MIRHQKTCTKAVMKKLTKRLQPMTIKSAVNGPTICGAEPNGFRSGTAGVSPTNGFALPASLET